jgi:hypothetical protein
MMTDLNILEKAIGAMVVLNAAFTNIRLYPSTSAMIGKSVDSAALILQSIFEQEDSLVFAESEMNLIVSGHALDEKDRKRPQVAAFIQLMLKLGIKSITFQRGLEKSEILSFLEVIVKKPEDLRKEGGIETAMSGKGIRNIQLDQKFYVAMDKSRQIIGAENKKDSAATAAGEQLLRIKTGINSIIKGELKDFKNRLVMQALPSTVLDLISRGKGTTADAIISRVGAGMLTEEAEVRSEAALAMARIGAKLITEKRMEEMLKLSPRLLAWIRFETMIPAAYKHISNQIQIISQYLILNHRLSEAREVLEPFHMITSGKLKKDQPLEVVSEGALKGVATPKVLESLIAELRTDENKFAGCAVDILVMLGSNSADPLRALMGEPEAPGFSVALTDDARKRIRVALERIDIQSAAPEAVAEQNMTENASEKRIDVDDEISRHIKLVDQKVQNKDIESAAKLLFELIVKFAREKDFEKAEILRDKLMAVNPMALNDIIKSGEIIEEEKNKSIDQAHLKRWSDLYNTLTGEESSTLFFALKTLKLDAGQMIFRKGDRDSKLYFINKGQIKLFFNQKGKELLIKELKPGELLGEDAFFSLTQYTSSAITLSPVELNYLEKSVLSKWESKSHGIESKLRDYYLKSKKVDDTSGKTGPQMRAQERIAIKGKVNAQFMNAAGVPVGEPITGALSDISQGGLSFYLNIKKEKISKMFLEPRLNLKFELKTEGVVHPIDQNGTMVAAIPHLYDYSIHVKFDNILDKKMIEDIKSSNFSGDGTLEILFKS